MAVGSPQEERRPLFRNQDPNAGEKGMPQGGGKTVKTASAYIVSLYILLLFSPDPFGAIRVLSITEKPRPCSKRAGSRDAVVRLPQHPLIHYLSSKNCTIFSLARHLDREVRVLLFFIIFNSYFFSTCPAERFGRFLV